MGSIRIDGISKSYKRYPKKWGRLAEWLSLGKHHEEHWVLRDISLDIAPGERVGIIGTNGAGKSTLLKIVSGTTKPTEGAITVEGRLSALLELGIGFHPEFTGRENCYMSGQIMGMSTQQITELMPAISDFAEIGDYMDQPVRTYSTGMNVRLAFSVATARRPDILIVDEALSVGDAYFQHKSFSRIRQFTEQGTTLLFVSHSLSAVKTLCDRAILLDSGLMTKQGNPEDIVNYYNAIIARQEADYSIQQVEGVTGQRVSRSGNSRAKILSVNLTCEERKSRAVIQGMPVVIEVRFDVLTQLDDLTVGFVIRDRLGNDIYGTNSFHLGCSYEAVDPHPQCFRFEVEKLALGLGNYSISVALHSRDAHTVENYDWWDHALAFQVIADSGPRSVGVARLTVTGRQAVLELGTPED